MVLVGEVYSYADFSSIAGPAYLRSYTRLSSVVMCRAFIVSEIGEDFLNNSFLERKGEPRHLR